MVAKAFFPIPGDWPSSNYRAFDLTTAPATATKFVIVARKSRYMHTPPRTGLINLDVHYNKPEFILSNISKIFTLTILKNTRNQSRGHEKRFSYIFSPEK